MRFVNISSDRIIFHDGYEQWELPYGELEKVVPDFLYTHVVSSADRTMIVLNGPGSFTNLRIVTLALNTMNTLHDFSWTFYPMTKLDRYAQMFRAGVKHMRRFCVMYIGQKKNIWFVDLERIVCDCDHPSNALQKYSLGEVAEIIGKKGENRCVDQMYAEGRSAVEAYMSLERMYAYEPEHAAIVTLPLGVKLLTPEYLMDANIDVGTKG